MENNRKINEGGYLMRGIINLLIVILITYTLNAVPINTTMLSFDLIKPWDKVASKDTSSVESDIPVYPNIQLIPNRDEAFINPSLVTVTFTSSDELDDSKIEHVIDHTTIYVTTGLMEKNYSLDHFTPKNNHLISSGQLVDGLWQYTLTLDFSAHRLQAYMGTYSVNVEMVDGLWQMNASNRLALEYIPDFTYKAAIPTVDESQVYTQVHYLNSSKEFLVPVTKKLSSSSKFIRSTISTLSYEPPSNDTIFAQDVRFPKMPRVYLNGGVLSCYLNTSEITQFDEGTKDSKLLSEAIVKSLTDIGYVDNLIFYVNNQQDGNFINGRPLKTVYNEDYNVYAYVNYSDRQGTSYLVPQIVGNGQETVEDLLSILKTQYTAVEDSGDLLATVPSDVLLIKKTQEGNLLNLTFSDHLYTVFDDAPDVQQMMMDSLVQTLTSLPSVDELILTTESHKSGQIGSVPLGRPIKANRFLNPIS